MTKSQLQNFDKTLHDKELSKLIDENKDLQSKLEKLRNEICTKSEQSFKKLEQQSNLRVKEYEEMINLYKQNQPLSEQLSKERDTLLEKISSLTEANSNITESFTQEQEYSSKLEEIIDFYERILGIKVLEKNDRFKLSRNGFQFYLQMGDKIKYFPVDVDKELPSFLNEEIEFEPEMISKFIENLFKYT